MKKSKKSIIKKLSLTVSALVLALGMTACGFSVGNTKDSEDYKEIFTDRAAELGNKYKASDLAYVFSLGDYGSMMVYVDTTAGHSFEVDSENGGFLIKDADGNEVLHAYGMPPEQYAAMTADTDEVKTVNGREFFYRKDQSYHHLLSYMADCGLDCGLILESDSDESVFRLVAFRGDAIEGASSDIYHYKGEATDLGDGSDTVPDTSSDDGSTGNTAGSAVVSSLSPEVEAALKTLDSDYSKINWGVRYSISEEYPGLIISVAPYSSYDSQYLIIGVTNMHDKDIYFKGNATALDASGNEIGDMFLYFGSIGPGSTVFSEIYCEDKMPDGRIHWEDCEVSQEVYQKYVLWKGDWATSGNPEDGSVDIDYSVSPATGESIVPGMITLFMLDENGNILSRTTGYSGDELREGESFEDSQTFYGDGKVLKRYTDVAMFVDSVK